ncbi:MAG: hypothetical protein GY814_04270 [Gammaproteobacteria bacterium]|nr:hypothetical protein [Gammaproteobacteria bacterium]
MTAQIGEGLIYHGRKVTMCTEPLGDYFAFGGERPVFAANCTALWRGYVGTWEVIDDRLYLVSLSGKLNDGTKITLETLFPGYPERVFAHWYSGTLRIPEGKRIEYVHMGYGSTFERDVFLEINEGVVTGTSVQNNGTVDNPNAT